MSSIKIPWQRWRVLLMMMVDRSLSMNKKTLESSSSIFLIGCKMALGRTRRLLESWWVMIWPELAAINASCRKHHKLKRRSAKPWRTSPCWASRIAIITRSQSSSRRLRRARPTPTTKGFRATRTRLTQRMPTPQGLSWESKRLTPIWQKSSAARMEWEYLHMLINPSQAVSNRAISSGSSSKISRQHRITAQERPSWWDNRASWILTGRVCLWITIWMSSKIQFGRISLAVRCRYQRSLMQMEDQRLPIKILIRWGQYSSELMKVSFIRAGRRVEDLISTASRVITLIRKRFLRHGYADHQMFWCSSWIELVITSKNKSLWKITQDSNLTRPSIWTFSWIKIGIGLRGIASS